MVNSSHKASQKRVSDRAFRKPRARRKLSIPVFVGTLVALSVLLPGLYFWRARQAELGAEAFVERADALAEQGDWAQ